MIARIWHGWTAPENADTYEKLLKEEIFPGLPPEGFRIQGNPAAARSVSPDEVEFVTIMVRLLAGGEAIAGEDHELAVVPPKARGTFKVRSALAALRGQGTARLLGASEQVINSVNRSGVWNTQVKGPFTTETQRSQNCKFFICR
jgi:hypothetical protein